MVRVFGIEGKEAIECDTSLGVRRWCATMVRQSRPLGMDDLFFLDLLRRVLPECSAE